MIAPFIGGRGALARRPCVASITTSASSTPAERLRGARLPALQHPACPLDACAWRNRQRPGAGQTVAGGGAVFSLDGRSAHTSANRAPGVVGTAERKRDPHNGNL